MHFIVCEQTGEWAASLRRSVPTDIAILETRSLVEMWESLEHTPNCLVALEFSAVRAEAILAAIVRLNRSFPSTTVVAFLPRSLQRWMPVVQEAGATHVVSSPRRLSELAEIMRRHTENVSICGPSAHSEPETLEERILTSLPWSE